MKRTLTNIASLAIGVLGGLIVAGTGVMAAWGPSNFVQPYPSLFQGATIFQAGTAQAPVVDLGVAAGTVSIDPSAGNEHNLIMPAGNTTVAWLATCGAASTSLCTMPGQSLRLWVIQDGTGSRTVTWPATIVWTGGSAPTLTTGANKRDQIRCYFDPNGKQYCDSTLNY